MNEQLLRRISECTELPTLPNVAVNILQLAKRPDVDLRDIADVISNDPALSSKILRTVNSSFYGLSKSVGTISQSLVILGLQSVKTLALGFSLSGSFSRTSPEGFDLMGYWRRAIHSAVSARALSEHLSVVQTEEAFLAALLQDIGVLAMYIALGEPYRQLLGEVWPNQEELLETENQTLQLNHAQVGQMLAEKWELPPVLSAPIGYHHDPDKADPQLRQLCRISHVAWRCADVFILNQPAESIPTVKQAGKHYLHLDESTVDRLLSTIGEAAKEVAGLFDVTIEPHVDYQSLLMESNQVLLDLTLQSQQRTLQLEDRNKVLQQAASTDPLTGLANRAKFNEHLTAEFKRARQFSRPITVLFADIDHFKHVNDTHGHPCGDEVLRAVARTIRSACRDLDLVARYGGEEFTCVLTETDMLAGAQLAEAIRLAVADQPVPYQDVTVPVTLSLGVATMEGGQHFTDHAQLLDSADRAMYAAKRSGRNCVRIYNPAATRTAIA